MARTDHPAEVVQVRSRWLIGADRANSAVRSHIGIDVEDSGFQAGWLLVDYRPRVEQRWRAFVTQFCDPAQPATAVNSGPGRPVRVHAPRGRDRRGTGPGQHSLAAHGAPGA